MLSDLYITMRSVIKMVSVAVLITLVMLVSGCDLDESDTRDINLSHKAHIEKRQMECIDCHEGAEDTDTPGMPDEALCLECHKTLDKELRGKGSPSGEKCLYCHNLKKDAPFGEHKVILGPGHSKDLISAHAAHYEKDVECKACHGDIANDDNKLLPRHKYMLSAEACMDCHAKRELSADCSTCHKSYGQTLKPDSHKADWLVQHGVESLLTGKNEHGKSCSTCHTENDCMECHTTQSPRDHTNFWRQQGHGIEAGMNRERCLACHQQDSCVRCHDETAPRNHRGAWGSSHCRACHLDGGFTPDDNNCAVCHRQAGHASASTRPANAVHNTATDCVTCHDLLNLSHPSTGLESDCTVCH